MTRCNAYGAENRGGYQDRPVGGLISQPVAQQPICTATTVHRFRWVCERGHRGPIVDLCEYHEAQFSGRAEALFEGGQGPQARFNGQVMPVPWNLRRDVRTCPRCASLAESPEHEPKVKVRLVLVS